MDEHGVPRDLDAHDYRTAARDAIPFPMLLDRLWHNLRRVVGFEVKYFAAFEPQRRLAPHVHAALRGTISRHELRLTAEATYHQVWWPWTDEVIYSDRHLPVWDGASAGYVDPHDGAVLRSWDEALDALSAQEDGQASHVVRFGTQLRAEGVLSGGPDSDHCIRYLVKYLNKSIDSCHDAVTGPQEEHLRRLWEALRYEPCSPTCANWLRCGVQGAPARDARVRRLSRPGLAQVVRQTLAVHRAERREWVRGLLGLADDPTPSRYVWMRASPTDPDVKSKEERLMLSIADRSRWRGELRRAQATAHAMTTLTPTAA